MFFPFLTAGAGTFEIVGKILKFAIQTEVAEQDGGGAAGVEIHDVCKTEKNSDEGEVDVFTGADGGADREMLFFQLLPEPSDVMVVADGDQFQLTAVGDSFISEVRRDFLKASAEARGETIVGMGFSQILCEQVIFNEVGAVTIAGGAEGGDEMALFQISVAETLVFQIGIKAVKLFVG